MSRNHLLKFDKKNIQQGGFVSVTTVAGLLDCSQSKVYAMIATKKLRGRKIDGMTRLFAKEVLDYVDVHATAM